MEEKRRTPQLPWPEWKIEGLLGRGGFGDVYRIRREEYGNVSLAALKVVRIPADESEIQELEANGISVGSDYKGMISDLLKEISLMESLKAATTVVTIEDYKIIEKKDSVGWVLFIRMELLTNLNVYRKSHVMSVKEVFKLGFDICSALEACQKKGIVHRDIKPSNILVSEFGDFKLGDFGISRNLTHTMSGLSRKGTELYMAPEVYRGNKYNATVDIYSLGLVLYSLLNHGRLPFFPRVPAEVTKNDSINAFSKRMRGEVFPDPDEGGREIGDVLRKACHIDPKMRYQSAAEFKGALINCQSREMTDARQHYAVHKQQVQPQSFIESEETISDVSIIKENTPVIKTENEKKSSRKIKKGTWKYVVMGIGLLAVAGLVGVMVLQKKPDNDGVKQTAMAELTATPTLKPTTTPTSKPTAMPTPEPTATSEIMSQEWGRVYDTLYKITHQGIFSYVGKTRRELGLYLLSQGGWKTANIEYDDEMQTKMIEYIHLQTETRMRVALSAGLIEYITIKLADSEIEYDVDLCVDALRRVSTKQEIYSFLGITSEMTQYIKDDEYSYSDGSFVRKFEDDYTMCSIEQNSMQDDLFLGILRGDKGISLCFDDTDVKELRRIIVSQECIVKEVW